MFYSIPENRPYSINPFTGEIMRLFEYHADNQVEKCLESSWSAYKIWSTTTLPQRSTALLQIANALENELESLSKCITEEMGKTLTESKAEIEKCVACLRFYADKGNEYLKPKESLKSKIKIGYRTESQGPVLAIMPWNFPFWQVVRVLAPALLLGNTIMLKHADNTPQCAIALEQLIESATGFPGLLTNVRIHHSHIERLIGDWRIRAVTLTGSEAAGRNVGMLAGKHLKKSVLELGGSDAFIVCKDADLALTIQNAVSSRLICNGQSCIAAKRFIVHQDIYEPFLAGFAQAMLAIKSGNPFYKETQLGPLTRPDLVAKLAIQVTQSLQKGAKAVIGTAPTPHESNFFATTILTNVAPGMPAFDEELFGPVAAIIKAKDEQQAVQLANHSKYGLGASIWTKDRALAAKLIPQIEAGSVFVNSIVRSDASLPFGGTKASGYGRELGMQGLMEFANIKTFSIS
jgi:succinate-semialdehyde dehydrogenase/glutarate-semialdehyde dehydrogenase